jgi:hypothetical protein
MTLVPHSAIGGRAFAGASVSISLKGIATINCAYASFNVAGFPDRGDPRHLISALCLETALALESAVISAVGVGSRKRHIVLPHETVRLLVGLIRSISPDRSRRIA